MLKTKEILLLVIVTVLFGCNSHDIEKTKLREKALGNDIDAKYNFANINYVDGLYATAKDYYSQAAIKGNKKAQLMLAIMYKDGKGGQKDYIRSYFWSALVNRGGATLEDIDYATELQTEVFEKLNLQQQSRAKLLIKNCADLEYNLEFCIASEKYKLSALPISP